MRKLRLTALAMMVAATTINAQNYKKGDPAKPDYQYLNEYADLKKYVNRSKYPNFKLGSGTTVSEYLKKGTFYNLINDNFDETVAGNAMKMASCVDGNGNMNFTNVTNYVNTATAAGLNVYGHTLAWHSQQANGWLRSLIKDKPAEPFANPDTTVYKVVGSRDFRTDQRDRWTGDKAQYGFSLNYSATNGLNVHTTKKVNSWEVQFIAIDNLSVEKNKTYKVTFDIKGSKSGNLHTKFSDWGSGPGGDIAFTTEWKEVSRTYKLTVDGAFLLLQCGDFVGDIYIRNINIEEPVGAMKINEPTRYLKVETTKKTSEVWDNQFWIVSSSTFASGAKYELTMDVRADKPAKASTQIHNSPGSYVSSSAIGDVSFTTDWNTLKFSGSFSASGQSIAFNLSELADANIYYFDNISLKVNGVEKITNGNIEGSTLTSFKMKKGGGSITAPATEKCEFTLQFPKSTPRTMEEKREILTTAMDKWISGMMKACNGKVKAWDLVNEAISGDGNDGSGNYLLQHSDGYNNSTAAWDVGGDAFYWQDHMGDLEYVRTACSLARKYGPADVKLFINDYNLESTWDSNKKLKSLIGWIKKWEADGVTKIDGIGTQMHISYYLDATSQNNQKKCITKMFELMAESGKLVRVSEFDMGLCDRQFGTAKATTQLTENEHKLMADYYEWIVKEYLRIIPPAQQWGICQWCPTDGSGALGTGWRGGEPVGIWTLNTMYRKHVYAGYVRGLGGEIYTSVNNPTVTEMPANNTVYDLQGRKVKNPSRGIYIINGKKVVLK